MTDQCLVLPDLAGFRCQFIHYLHQKYGPVVRIAPNEVSFADISAVKDIYGQSAKVVKAPIYENFPPGIFSMRTKEDRRERRKQMSHVFSTSHLITVEPVVQGKVQGLLDVLADAKGAPFDMIQWFRMFSLDVISIESARLC
jgi:cytochrome P450